MYPEKKVCSTTKSLDDIYSWTTILLAFLLREVSYLKVTSFDMTPVIATDKEDQTHIEIQQNLLPSEKEKKAPL